MSLHVVPVSESRPALRVESAPTCPMVMPLLGPWRQGMPRAAVIATMKFSLAERRRPCTPAMAAGLTDYVWSLRAVLLFRVPPWPQLQARPWVSEEEARPTERDRCVDQQARRAERGIPNWLRNLTTGGLTSLKQCTRGPWQLSAAIGYATVRAARLAYLPLPAPSPPPVRVRLPFVLRSGVRWYRFCCVVRARTVSDILYRTPLKTLSADAVAHSPQEGQGPGLLCGRGGGAVRLYLLSP
jgi:hypothetical protein